MLWVPYVITLDFWTILKFSSKLRYCKRHNELADTRARSIDILKHNSPLTSTAGLRNAAMDNDSDMQIEDFWKRVPYWQGIWDWEAKSDADNTSESDSLQKQVRSWNFSNRFRNIQSLFQHVNHCTQRSTSSFASEKSETTNESEPSTSVTPQPQPCFLDTPAPFDLAILATDVSPWNAETGLNADSVKYRLNNASWCLGASMHAWWALSAMAKPVEPSEDSSAS